MLGGDGESHALLGGRAVAYEGDALHPLGPAGQGVAYEVAEREQDRKRREAELGTSWVSVILGWLAALGASLKLTAPTFLIVLGSVALAAAIAFGWGARNVAQDIVERAYDSSGARERVVEQRDDGAADTDAASPGSPTGAAGRPDARRLDR